MMHIMSEVLPLVLQLNNNDRLWQLRES